MRDFARFISSITSSSFKSGVVSAVLVAAAFVAPAAAQINDKQFEDAMSKYLATQAGKETLGKAVESYFMERQKEMQRKQQEDQARQVKEQLEESFKNPVSIDAGNSPSKGPANAKITIIEFSDFQCPYCKRGADNIERVKEMYPNDVRIVFKNLPLDFHDEAEPAARAALAAGKQGKFWEMYKALFDNQQKLGSDFYTEQAKTLGLNVDKFKADMASDEITKQIEADKALARQHNIQGTPAFFVNGVAVRGAYPPDHFKMIIDRLLGKAAEEKKAV